MASRAFDLVGLRELNARLAQVVTGTVDEVGQQLYEVANEIMTESKEVVPVDVGALRASGQVGLPEVEGSTVTVTMGYGDTAVGYAVEVHERADVYHKPPTGWKYLENPVNAAAERVGEAVEAGVRAAFEKGA